MNLEVPVAELQKHKLFVATPMYGGQCFGSYTKSILDLSRACQSYGIEAQFSFLFNESLITRARNYLVDEFVRSGFSHLMFIDSDIDFNPMDVIALLALDKPIIGGPYPKKCVAWENVYDAARYGLVTPDDRGRLADYAGDFVFNTVPGTSEIKLDTAVEVLEIGTGFMLVKREVFTQFSEAYPQYWYNPDHNRSAAFDGSRKIFQYFQAEIEPERGRYLSEDYWFCQKARQAGMGVWFAPWMKIKHHGTYIYGGSIPAMAQVVQERITRGDAAPSVIRMDHSGGTDPKVTVEPGTPPGPDPDLTMVQFNALSATKRKAYLTTLSIALHTDAETLKAYWLARRESWLADIPDAPLKTRLATLVATGVEAQVSPDTTEDTDE